MKKAPFVFGNPLEGSLESFIRDLFPEHLISYELYAGKEMGLVPTDKQQIYTCLKAICCPLGHGQLFQNRYKSIVCQEEVYLRELVRYIHLNPLRAGIVRTLTELNNYAYSGHSVLMGRKKRPWQDVDYVLSYFGHTPRRARKDYYSYLAKLRLKSMKIESKAFHRRAAEHAEMIHFFSLPLTPVK